MWIKKILQDRAVQCHIGDIIEDIVHTEWDNLMAVYLLRCCSAFL